MLSRPRSLLATNDPQDVDDIWPVLKKAGYGTSEKDLLRAISDNASKRLVFCATIGLQFNGSTNAVSVLKSLKNYPDTDVRSVHVMSVAKIAGSNETLYYADLLHDTKYHEKSYALAALWEFGDRRGTEAVVDYVSFALRGSLTYKEWDWRDSPLYVVDYLRRVKYDDRVSLERLLSKQYLRKNWYLVLAIRYWIKNGNLFT